MKIVPDQGLQVEEVVVPLQSFRNLDMFSPAMPEL